MGRGERERSNLIRTVSVKLYIHTYISHNKCGRQRLVSQSVSDGSL